jgi:hypothetical protein
MRNGIFPIFTKGRVLKKDSVEYLRDFPYDLASLIYTNYSDGLLCGFLISSVEGNILVSKGALKHQGNIIVVPESTIWLEEYEQLQYVKLMIGKRRETEDYHLCPMEVVIDRRLPNTWNEIELGRFCLNPGAILRCDYDSFSDLRTPENTLDLTRVSYAGKGAPTLHPRVLQEFARELLMYSADPTDISFSLMCLNSNLVHKSAIQWFIAKKFSCDYKEYLLSKLYEKLLEMLPEHGLKGKRVRPRGHGPAID